MTAPVAPQHCRTLSSGKSQYLLLTDYIKLIPVIFALSSVVRYCLHNFFRRPLHQKRKRIIILTTHILIKVTKLKHPYVQNRNAFCTKLKRISAQNQNGVFRFCAVMCHYRSSLFLFGTVYCHNGSDINILFNYTYKVKVK